MEPLRRRLRAGVFADARRSRDIGSAGNARPRGPHLRGDEAGIDAAAGRALGFRELKSGKEWQCYTVSHTVHSYHNYYHVWRPIRPSGEDDGSSQHADEGHVPNPGLRKSAGDFDVHARGHEQYPPREHRGEFSFQRSKGDGISWEPGNGDDSHQKRLGTSVCENRQAHRACG